MQQAGNAILTRVVPGSLAVRARFAEPDEDFAQLLSRKAHHRRHAEAEHANARSDDEEATASQDARVIADKLPLTLDRSGAGKLTIDNVPQARQPQELLLEATYADPNGEVQTIRSTQTLWPAAVVAGIKTEGWVSARQKMRFQALALQHDGKAAPDTSLQVQAIARIKSREFRKDAARRADEMKAQAQVQMDELQKKSEEMKRQSEVQSQQMKLKSEKLKAQARIQMQEAKVQADKLKEQVRTQTEIAQDKANELKEKVNARADDYRRNVSAAANRAKADILGYVDDFRTKTEERAAQIRAKDRNAKGGAIEGSEFSQETVGKSSEKTKK